MAKWGGGGTRCQTEGTGVGSQWVSWFKGTKWDKAHFHMLPYSLDLVDLQTPHYIGAGASNGFSFHYLASLNNA